MLQSETYENCADDVIQQPLQSHFQPSAAIRLGTHKHFTTGEFINFHYTHCYHRDILGNQDRWNKIMSKHEEH